MMRGVLILFTFVSVIFFPWPFTALLVLGVAFVEPLVPFAAGLFADTLYYTASAHVWPLFTLAGAAVTIIAVLVRSRLRTSTIR